MMDRGDDEISTLFEDVGEASDFQAGYRAGLEEVTEELERLLDLPDEVRDSTMDVYDLKRWIDFKLKEQA